MTEDVNEIFRGSSVQRLLRNYNEDKEIFSRTAPPRRAYGEDEDIPRLVPARLYLTSSPTRAASCSRSMPGENEINALDWPLVLEMKASDREIEEYFDIDEWEQRGIIDYTGREFPAEMVSTVYVLDDDHIGEQLPSEETVELSEYSEWDFQEYRAFLGMFSDLTDSAELLE